MPTKKKAAKKRPAKAKRPAKMNPLAQYVLTESVRESGTPDRSTKAQVKILMGGKKKKSPKKKPNK